jgi:hypothetical protein
MLFLSFYILLIRTKGQAFGACHFQFWWGRGCKCTSFTHLAQKTGDADMCLFFPWRWGGSSTQAWMPTYISILRIPQMIWVWRTTVEWYWQGKTEELREKPVLVPLCPPQIPHGLTRVKQTRLNSCSLCPVTAVRNYLNDWSCYIIFLPPKINIIYSHAQWPFHPLFVLLSKNGVY